MIKVVLASGPAFEQEFAFFGYNDHFRSASVTRRQWRNLVDYANIIMAEDLSQLLGGKMCAAPWHKAPYSTTVKSQKSATVE